MWDSAKPLREKIRAIANTKGGMSTGNQTRRTCVRMSEQEYRTLKQKSAEAGKSANAWLMGQLGSNRPVVYRERETWDVLHFMDEAGRKVNAVARDFNSGYGTVEQLRDAVRLLTEAFERIHALRKKGYPYAP